MMAIKPLDDRVFVRPLELEEKVGSILIPDTAKEKPMMGEVLAVGTDEELTKVLKTGDRVIYGKYAGQEFKMEGVKHLLLSRSDILAVVRD